MKNTTNKKEQLQRIKSTEILIRYFIKTIEINKDIILENSDYFLLKKPSMIKDFSREIYCVNISINKNNNMKSFTPIKIKKEFGLDTSQYVFHYKNKNDDLIVERGIDAKTVESIIIDKIREYYKYTGFELITMFVDTKADCHMNFQLFFTYDLNLLQSTEEKESFSVVKFLKNVFKLKK